MKNIETSDIIKIVIALIGGGVSILGIEKLEYKIPVAITFFVLAIIFTYLLIKKKSSKTSKNSSKMKEIKEKLLNKFTIVELLDLIQNNFNDHFLKEGYAGKTPEILNIQSVITKLVTYCNMKDKTEDLNNLIK